MCKANFACNEVTFSEYLTTEIIVMGVASCLHIPFWFFILLIVDIKKNGGRVRDAFKLFKVRKCSIPITDCTNKTVFYRKKKNYWKKMLTK